MAGKANSSSVKKRRRKVRQIHERLHELRNETSVERVLSMEEEFGPYWYYLLYHDTIPQYLKDSRRYRSWVRSIDPLHQE